MENPGQRYASVVDNPPEPPLRRHEDDAIEIELDDVIKEKLALLWQHRGFVAKFVGIGLIVSLILAFVIPKRYESTVRLMPPDAASAGSILPLLMGGSGGGGGSALGLAASLLGGKTTGQLFIGVLGGPSVTDPVIERLNLREEYKCKYIEDCRKILFQHLSVDEDRKSGIISISGTAKSPEAAQALAQGMADQLDTVLKNVSNSSAKRERIFLENRLKSVKVELDDAAVKLAKFSSTNVAFDVPAQAKAYMEAAAKGQAELIIAESELEGLRQIYTDNNSRVKAVEGRVAELRKQVDVQNKGEGAPGTMINVIKSLPKLGLQWADLYRTATVDEAVYEALIKQYEFAKVQEAKETTSVAILDRADRPEKKAFPKRSMVMIYGLLFSMALASSYVIAKDRWHQVPIDHPVKLYVEETRANLMSRWRRNNSNATT